MYAVIADWLYRGNDSFKQNYWYNSSLVFVLNVNYYQTSY